VSGVQDADHDGEHPVISKDLEPPSFDGTDINHVAIRVSNLARSRDFYVAAFGAVVTNETPTACFLQLGEHDFIALFLTDIPHIEHFCITVPDYDPDAAEERLRASGLDVIRREDRVFFRDPDGLLVQISGPPGGAGRSNF
jgi:catechol 2,3-dioxygenase-like lactoylglutathione lyase family enzyme